MTSTAGTIVARYEDGSVHVYRVIADAFDEPRGRPPTVEELEMTRFVATRPPPLSWSMTVAWEPRRSAGGRHSTDPS